MVLLQLFLLLFSFAETTLLVHSQTGFISIDCGIDPGTNYTDSTTGITYVSDEGYIDTGENNRIDSAYLRSTASQQDATLRSFPDGTRNCYTLKPVVKGSKYLVRAIFFHGNYDGLHPAGDDRLVKFDLYLGTDLWENIEQSTKDTTFTEIFTKATADYIWVCLVRNGSDVPFISVLELRPVKNTLYSLVNETTSLKLFHRGDVGATQTLIRYPDDNYDRFWQPFNKDCWVPVTTNETVKYVANDAYEAPQVVLRTALHPSDTCLLSFSWKNTGNNESYSKYHIVMHIPELMSLQTSDLRMFNIFLNGQYLAGPYAPGYLEDSYLFTSIPLPGNRARYNFSFLPTDNSTLPPIMSAFEIYIYVDRVVATNFSDVAAIIAVKDYYQIHRNWMGDPCVPNSFIWDGLNCSYSATPVITALNLSSSGLNGSIPVDFGDLPALTYLDLSSNNLTGEIPAALGGLLSLKYLNLSGNNLNLSSIPQPLLDRAKSGVLTLSPSPNVCNGSLCERVLEKRKKKISATLITIFALVPAILLLAVLVVLVQITKRRKSGTLVRKRDGQDDLLSSETSRQFTYAELKDVTENFRQVIGEGGFGSVYLGYLENETQVAVKMRSQLSSQGTKEFLAEAQLLTRVHHRNLVSLVGYCKDKYYQALVYEYMSQGSLQDHLNGKAKKSNSLSWMDRLHIALEASQGLDYLHKGCKPPIIHRDVKTSNILLSEKLEAKLGDLGVSRAFQNDSATHITTAVVGSPGYLDPEYQTTYQITEKSDVYSFGVVLLELVTGKPPILNGVETCHVTQWVKVRIDKGDIAEVVDAKIQEHYDPDSVWKVVDIALSCTLMKSSLRPTMSEVVQQLKEALDLQVKYERSNYSNSTGSHTAGFRLSSMMHGPHIR